MNAEVWKYIDDYDNYQVSSLERVRNIKFGKFLQQNVNINGYN